MSKKVTVRPLALATCCDHHARVRLGSQKQSEEKLMPRNAPVIGLVLGTQTGIDICIMDTVDAVYTVSGTNNEHVALDREAAEMKVELASKIAPNIELLGWYTFGTRVTDAHLEIQNWIRELNVASILMLVDPNPKPDSKVLPLIVYDSELHFVEDVPQSIFVELPFNMDAPEAERIAVEQVMKSTPSDGVTPMEIQSQAMVTSLKKLVDELEEITSRMKAGTMNSPFALRSIAKICNQMDGVYSTDFESKFSSDMETSLMFSSLAGITDMMSMTCGTAQKIAQLNKESSSMYHLGVRKGMDFI
jgi:COP9 signalosome complex subunit 6